MDTKTLLLGSIPPALAFLAEARNPVSAEVIRPQARLHAGQHIADPPQPLVVAALDPAAIEKELTDAAARTADTRGFLAAGIPAVLARLFPTQTPGAGRPRDPRSDHAAAVEALASTMTAVAETAVEVGGIIPTWISFTAATAAVLLEFVDVPMCLLLLLVFTLLSSLFGIPLFQQINYRDAAMITPPTPGRLCGSLRQVDCISRCIKAANLALVLLVIGVWIGTNFQEILKVCCVPPGNPPGNWAD